MNSEKPRFLMLVGIAGSGKSTVAKELMEERLKAQASKNRKK